MMYRFTCADCIKCVYKNCRLLLTFPFGDYVFTANQLQNIAHGSSFSGVPNWKPLKKKGTTFNVTLDSVNTL